MKVTFDMLTPASLQEALGMLEKNGASITPVAGGTNLIVDCQSGRHQPAVVMDVHNLAELNFIEEQDGRIQVGAGTTIRAIEQSEMIRQTSNALYKASIQFANPLIRNRATLAGNLCDGSPASDMAVPLLALGAEVQLTSKTGTRWMPLDTFFMNVRKTERKADELLTTVSWPIPVKNSANAFYKLGLRKADAISVVSLAVYIAMESSGRISEARIALGSVAPIPVRAYEAEKLLEDKAPDETLFAQAAKSAAMACSPISDVRATAEYRREMVDVLVKRLLKACVEQIGS